MRMSSAGMSRTPDLRRHDDHAVLGDVVAGGTQAVAIEHRANHGAVGERDRRRTVPGLHERRVVLVEGAQLRAHLLVRGPRLGNHHQHGVRQRSPRHHEELEHVVERGGIAAPLPDDRQELAEIVAEHGRSQQAFPGAHPVDVAAQRIDLAVVRDVAIGMRERPGREGVRAEPLVHERQRRLEILVVEIRERRLDLVRRQHPLVDQRARRQAADIAEVPFGERQRIDRVLDALANHI